MGAFQLEDRWVAGKKLTPVIELVGNYFEELEYDFHHELHVDLLKLVGKRRWAKIWRLKSRLPADGWYGTALAMDPELAEQLVALDDDDEVVEPPTPLGYTKEVHLLAAVVDGLQQVCSVLIAVNGGDAPRVTPFPRPQTAKDRLKDQLWARDMNAFADELLGVSSD